MPQIFHRSSNTLARVSILGGLFIVGALSFAVYGYMTGDYTTQVNVARDQPVRFSHEHHVAGLGIDCRYCHTTVESSNFAGIPATKICMTCHSQIWTNAAMLAPVRKSLADNTPIPWTRVAKLPDYVFFRHDIHIAKGVACVECHGRIDRMPLTYRAKAFTMQFCIDCHRDPAPHLRPKDHVTDMAWKPPADARKEGEKIAAHEGIRFGELTHCYVCHR